MKTVLHDVHLEAGAAMVDYHGWDMPLRYTGIPPEHLQVREAAGIFDLCHMGRLEVSGEAALEWIDTLVTANIEKLRTWGARYSLICHEDGGILDDIIVYRLPDRFLMVVNAANRLRVIDWFEKHREGRAARLEDRTLELGMISVQGPATIELLARLIEAPVIPIEELPYYRMIEGTIAGETALVATTGYTGETGLEMYLPVRLLPEFWSRVLENGKGKIAPIGLGARDTLRIEAAMPLYGNEISAEINPYEAGLGFAVKLEKERRFIGQEALTRINADGAERKLIGLRIDSRKIARSGMPIFQKGRPIGVVTSGIPSPSLGYPIALALIDHGVSNPEGIEVDIRDTRCGALPVPLPFCSSTRPRGKKAL